MADETTTASPEAPQPPSLSIDDLRNLLAIIDLASKRGAFLPKEFGPIGEVYNKVDAFLASTVQAPPAAPPADVQNTGN